MFVGETIIKGYMKSRWRHFICIPVSSLDKHVAYNHTEGDTNRVAFILKQWLKMVVMEVIMGRNTAHVFFNMFALPEGEKVGKHT